MSEKKSVSNICRDSARTKTSNEAAVVVNISNSTFLGR
jgi:hypothetical protein